MEDVFYYVLTTTPQFLALLCYQVIQTLDFFEEVSGDTLSQWVSKVNTLAVV